MSKFFPSNILFTQFRENNLEVKTLDNSFFNAFTNKFTFQTYYLITPIWRWKIYLWLHQIWAQLEKFAIGLARHFWHHLPVITVLLADSGWTQPKNIIFPLFLLEGSTLVPITLKADCALSIVRLLHCVLACIFVRTFGPYCSCMFKHFPSWIVPFAIAVRLQLKPLLYTVQYSTMLSFFLQPLKKDLT